MSAQVHAVYFEVFMYGGKLRMSDEFDFGPNLFIIGRSNSLFPRDKLHSILLEPKSDMI